MKNSSSLKKSNNTSPTNSSNFMSFKEENYTKSTDQKHETVKSSFLENKHLALQKQLRVLALFYLFQVKTLISMFFNAHFLEMNLKPI